MHSCDSQQSTDPCHVHSDVVDVILHCRCTTTTTTTQCIDNRDVLPPFAPQLRAIYCVFIVNNNNISSLTEVTVRDRCDTGVRPVRQNKQQQHTQTLKLDVGPNAAPSSGAGPLAVHAPSEPIVPAVRCAVKSCDLGANKLTRRSNFKKQHKKLEDLER